MYLYIHLQCGRYFTPPITYKLASIHVQVYIEVYIFYLYKYRFRKGNFEICHVA